MYGNPLKFVDPSGHDPRCGPDGIWCGYDGSGYAGGTGSGGGGGDDNNSGGIVSLLPDGPACTINYCGQPNNFLPPAETNNITGFLQTLDEFKEYFNWSLTTPGEMTLFTTHGYPFLGGARVFYQPFYTLDNNSPLTVGPTYISSGSISIGFNGAFRYKEGLNSVSALVITAPFDIQGKLQPWAFKVGIDTTMRTENSVFTHRIGVEYVARPDNLTYVAVPAAIYVVSRVPVLIPLIGKAIQQGQPQCVPGLNC